MNKKRLSNDEISNVLEQLKKTQNNTDRLKMYRSKCPEFTSNNCDGEIYSEGGCSICEYFNIHDSTNGKPPVGTKRWEEMIKDYNKETNKMVENCNLKFNTFYCKYKDAFNFCYKCNCVYKEKLNEDQR